MNSLPSIPELLTAFLGGIIQYFIVAGAAYIIFWKMLKPKIIHLFIQKEFPKKSRINEEIKYSILSLVIAKAVVLFIVVAKVYFDLTLIYDNISDYGWPYYFLSFVLMLVLHDTYFYWTHRLMHHPKIFKHVHLVHHKSTNPSPWAAHSFHPWEAIITALIAPIIVFIIPVHSSAIMIFFLLSLVRNVWGHMGYEFFPKGFTQNKWLNWNTTTTHHNMHHKHFNGNYGFYFTFWDRIMKTEAKKYHEVFEEVAQREPEVDSENSDYSFRTDSIKSLP